MIFFPRVVRRDVCDSEDARRMCHARRVEVVNGAFYWDERRGGYCATQLPGPLGLPVLLDACPFCHELLPGVQARKRFAAKLEAMDRRGQPDEGEGAE